MKRKIAVIGKGNVGGALEAGLSKAGYETKMVGRGAGVTEAAAWGDIMILAFPSAPSSPCSRRSGHWHGARPSST